MYLLRVLLPDEPGSLGAVASALGAVGADIVTLDVVERQADGTVIDDLLVELPLGGRADTLVSAARSIPGVEVTWLSRYNAGGDLHRDLEAVEAMTERPSRADRVLVDLAPGIFHADWAALITIGSAGGEVRHATPGAPGLPNGTVPWLPLSEPTRLELPDDWSTAGWRDLTAGAVPLGAAQTSVVIARRGGPELLNSELARLAHLAALATTISDGNRSG